MENIERLLEDLLSTLGSLLNVMTKEHDLLCSKTLSTAGLQRVTEEKNALLAKIDEFGKLRTQMENKVGISPPYNDFPLLASRWSDIRELGQKLRDQNQHNGLLLDHRIEHNKQALSVLNKQNNSLLYGPDGLSRPSNSQGRGFRA